MFSTVGTRSLAVAYPLLALTLTGSPVNVGWAGFALMAPSLLFYIPAGVLVDRLNPRLLMLGAQFGRLIMVGLVTLMALTLAAGGDTPPWALPSVLVAAFVEGTLWVLYSVAETTLIPSVVTAPRLPSALAQSETSLHIGVLVGRNIGGVLYGFAPAVPFGVNVVLFFFSLPLLLRRRQLLPLMRRLLLLVHRRRLLPLTRRLLLLVRRRQSSHQGGDAAPATRTGETKARNKWPFLKEIKRSFEELRRHQFLRKAIFVTSLTGLLINTLITVFIAGSTDLSPVKVGLVLACGGAGGVVGAVLSRFRPRRHLLNLHLWAWALALGVAALGQRPIAFAGALLVTGYVGAVTNVAIRTYEIDCVARAMLGRVASVSRLTGYGVVCVAGPLGALVFSTVGEADAVWVLFGVMSLIALLLTRWMVVDSDVLDRPGLTPEVTLAAAGDRPPLPGGQAVPEPGRP